MNRSFKYKNTCVGLISRYELIHWRSLFTEFYDVVFTQENAHCCPVMRAYLPHLNTHILLQVIKSGQKLSLPVTLLAMTFSVLKSSMSSAIIYQSYEPVNAFLSINRHIISRFLYEPFTPTICCRFYTLLREPVKNYLADFFR